MRLLRLPIILVMTLLPVAIQAAENEAVNASMFKLPAMLVSPGATPVTKQELLKNSSLYQRVKQNSVVQPQLMSSMSPEHELDAINNSGDIANEDSFSDGTPPVRRVAFSFLDSIKAKYKPQQSLGSLKPGSNIAVPVAAGITNPIITNFKMVAVRTHDEDAIIELEDGRVYITLNSLKPVGLMVFEEGVPESMINLTLVPMNAMPVVVNLKVKQTKSMLNKGRKYRAKIKEDSALASALATKTKPRQTDHISYIKDVLKPIGNGNLPRGFTLSTDTSNAIQLPCSITIEQKVMQRIVGLREVVDVVRVKNNHQRPYSVREQACESKDTIAVAIYNKSLLQPGEATEVYIMRDKLIRQRNINTKTRPRVIN